MLKQNYEIEPKIIKGCLKRKLRYQEILYKQYYAYGMSISLRYSYSRDEAVEILNDSFLKVFENIDKFDTNRPFKAWFRKILVNTAIDYYRKNIKHNMTRDIEEHDLENTDFGIIDKLNVEDMMRLLNTLPEIYRITFNLYEIEGYKHDEIAEILNITASTSRSNLTRAKKMLRNSFKKTYGEIYARVV